MTGIQLGLTLFASFLIVISVIPLIRSDYWTFRVFDFPRVQKLVLSIAILLLMGVCFTTSHLSYPIVFFALIANCVYLLTQVLPFTIVGKKWVLSVDKQIDDQCISILVSNVFQDNRNYQKCLDTIKGVNADVVLLLETDNAWANNVSSLHRSYPHRILVPIENTYGMLLFSKLPLRTSSVEYLVESEIPSIHTQVQLPSGKWIQLYCLHPTPPVPNENPRSTERDKELLLVADLAKENKLPVIVMGDMNDVAWSYTTELFLKMSGLLDPRRGRGFYNSFNAHHRIMRFPLDHVFVSPHFKLVAMKRMPTIDSDHFPIYGKYQYEKGADEEQEIMEASAEDEAIAEETKAKETEI